MPQLYAHRGTGLPPRRRKEGKSGDQLGISHLGQNYKWQQLSCLDPGSGRARSAHCREGGRQRPPSAALLSAWPRTRPVAKSSAPAVRTGQAAASFLPGAGQLGPPASPSLPPPGPLVMAPPLPAWPPCPRLPPPRAATGASRSRKLTPLPRLCSTRRVHTRCTRRAIPGPGVRPHEDSDPATPLLCPLPATLPPHGEGPRRKPSLPSSPTRQPARRPVSHGCPGTAAGPRRRGRPGP